MKMPYCFICIIMLYDNTYTIALHEQFNSKQVLNLQNSYFGGLKGVRRGPLGSFKGVQKGATPP